MEHFFFTRGVSLSWLFKGPFARHPEEAVIFQRELCRHHDSCFKNALIGAAKALVIGYGITATIAIFRVISSKRRRNRIKTELYKILFDQYNVKFAKFLAAFVFTLKGANCFLRRNRGMDDGFNAITAGYLAGWTLFIMGKGSGRADLSLYIWSRAVDVVIHLMAGRVPGKSMFHYGWGVLVFMLLQGVIQHTHVAEKHNLKSSYSAWIDLLAGPGVREWADDIALHVAQNEGYEYPTQKGKLPSLRQISSKTAINVLIGSKRYLESSLSRLSDQNIRPGSPQPSVEALIENENVPTKATQVDCTQFHPSCPKYWFRVFFNSFKEAFKMYLPLYTLPRVVFGLFSSKNKLTFLQKKLLSTLYSSVRDTSRSACFLGLYAGILVAANCIAINTFSRAKRIHVISSGLICGVSLAAEKPTRYAELNLYCLPRAAEAFYNVMVEHLARSTLKFHETPGLDVALFSWSCAVLFWAMQFQQSMVRSPFRLILGQLIGEHN